MSFCTACGFSSEPEDADFPVEFNAPCGGQIEVIDDLTIRFCGATSQRAVEQLVEVLESGPYQRLVIDSLGGNTRAAITLGRVLNQQDTTLYINHVCLSSCAQFVMLGAKQVFLRETSVVGMHDSQSSTNTLIAEQLVSQEMVQEAQMERAYYVEVGAPTSLLFEPMSRLGIACIWDVEGYLKTGAMRVKSDYDYYIPDEKFITDNYPGSLLTPWPESNAVRKRLNEVKLEFHMNLDQTTARGVDVPLAACDQ